MPDHHFSDRPPELPLDRYLAGEATPAQAEQVEAWLAGDPFRARFLAELRTAGEGVVPSIDVVALSARIEQRIDDVETASRRVPSRRIQGSIARRQSAWRQWLSLGLGLAAIVAVGRYGGDLLRSATTANSTIASQSYATRDQERATIQLADGSRVTLAPHTTVTLASNFGVGMRQVTVDGEAYFVVAHSAGAPFTVQAGGAVARVLGTSFVVRKFANDAMTRIVVAEGKVAVRAAHAPESSFAQGVLTASTMAVVSDSGAVTLTSGVSVDDYVSWTDGRLVFRDTPLREVVSDLARAYGVTITTADTTLLGRQITLTAATSQRPLTDVLDVLVAIVDAHYTKAGNVITIQSGPRTTGGPRWSAPIAQEKQYGR